VINFLIALDSKKGIDQGKAGIRESACLFLFDTRKL
jgi:hypothetical protein